jgi:hypothetical protein
MGYNLFNPIGLGILGKLKQGGAEEEPAVLWDGTYRTSTFVASPNVIFNDQGAGLLTILIDVSTLSVNDVIRVTESSNGDRFRFAGLVELISELPIQGGGTSSVAYVAGAYSDLSADPSAPYEYEFTIPAGVNTVAFYMSTVGSQIVTSVEVL